MIIKKFGIVLEKMTAPSNILEILTDHEKSVFKTYSEIDQMDIIYQAANRQNHIDQGQSLNIMVHPDMSPKEINKIHLTGLEIKYKIFVLST